MKYRRFLKHIDQHIPKVNPEDYSKAVFILHDQLNLKVWPDWIQQEKPLLIFIESKAKGESLPYHKKKLIYLLSSMRHFALECAENGYPVLYYSTKKHYEEGVSDILKKAEDLKLSYMCPSEWDSRLRLRKVSSEHKGRVHEIPNNFFLAEVNDYKSEIGKGYRMEYFYRDMRRRTGYLMEGKKPAGGQWNFDEENRKRLPSDIRIPKRAETEPDEIMEEVTDLVESEFSDHFGDSSEFTYAVTRRQALYRLNEFIDERLDQFGPYEDAMTDGNYVLFHSHLSLYLNNGLLLPDEVCDRAQEAYKKGNARLSSAEGFIRQIIGWREFIRIYYEAMMPEVRKANHFGFKNKLPEVYWRANSKMHCVNECIKPVIHDGYSHHIPRLMVLSNFSNLTETDPRELNKWFWFGYADAYEWVVLPNVLGMATFADGGILASKPYVSSGNYINKMSDFCKSCTYKITKKTGEAACPFNYLYWNFVDRHRDTFAQNNRTGFMVNMFDKKSGEDKQKIRESSRNFIDGLQRMK